jgi:hypothetical protein
VGGPSTRISTIDEANGVDRQIRSGDEPNISRDDEGYLEPDLLPNGFFHENPDKMELFKRHLWIPDDGRVGLKFSVKELDRSDNFQDVRLKTLAFHRFQDYLRGKKKFEGGICILDNDLKGHNKIFETLPNGFRTCLVDDKGNTTPEGTQMIVPRLSSKDQMENGIAKWRRSMLFQFLILRHLI